MNLKVILIVIFALLAGCEVFGQIKPKQMEYSPSGGSVLYSKDTTAIDGRTGKYAHYSLETLVRDSIGVVDTFYVEQDSILNWRIKGVSYKDTIRVSGGGAIQNLSYDSANHEVDISDGGTSAVIPLALADGGTEGLASFTASDFNASSGN